MLLVDTSGSWPEVVGSNPSFSKLFEFKWLTQLVECFAYNEKVNGSNPLLPLYDLLRAIS